MSVGRFNTGPRFFDGPQSNNPINNHLLLKKISYQERRLLGISDTDADNVFTDDGVVPLNLLEESTAPTNLEKRVVNRVNKLQGELAAHAARSERLNQNLDRALKNAKEQQQTGITQPRQQKSEWQRAAQILTQNRNSWGKPPPKKLSYVQESRRLRKERSVVNATISRSTRLAKLPSAERKRLVSKSRSQALQRLRQKAVWKGKNIKTSKKEEVRAQRQRASLSDLRYGF